MMTRADWENLVDMMGVPMALVQAQPPEATVPLQRVGLRTMDSTDPLVNSYGVGAKVLTIKASELGATVPQKFDALQDADGERLVLDHVTRVHLPGTGGVVGYRCFVKGRQP